MHLACPAATAGSGSDHRAHDHDQVAAAKPTSSTPRPRRRRCAGGRRRARPRSAGTRSGVITADGSARPAPARRTSPRGRAPAARGAAASTADEAPIRRGNVEYWDKHAPTLPDALYDQLVERLRRQRPDAALLQSMGPSPSSEPVLAADEAVLLPPGERFGAGVIHKRPMLSLDKCYGADDLVAWASKFEGEILVMPKMDGVACCLRYDRKGKLVLAATRGSGTEGEDITANALEIKATSPATLQGPRGQPALEVRGERLHEALRVRPLRRRATSPTRATWRPARSSTRTAARAAPPTRSASSPTTCSGASSRTSARSSRCSSALGFAAEIDHEFVPREQLQAAYERFARARAGLDYEIDGVVYRADRSVDEQTRLGLTGHHPRWSIAFKFQGDRARPRSRTCSGRCRGRA